MEDQGSISRRGGEGNFFSLRYCVQTAPRTHPASRPVGTWRSFPHKAKRFESQADHSPSSSAEIRNEWSYTSTSLYVFMASCLIKQKDKFTLPFRSKNSLTEADRE
jgi:hypothetical protein